MSTEIYTECETLSLSNLMFRRVIEFASGFAREQVASEDSLSWIGKFAALEELSGQSMSTAEVFSSAEEVNFWAKILFDCAQAIYDRKIGNQDNPEWQVSTIWALFSFARMLATEYTRRSSVGIDNGNRDPEWRKVYQRRYNRLNRKLSKTLQEREEMLARMHPGFPTPY